MMYNYYVSSSVLTLQVRGYDSTNPYNYKRCTRKRYS